MSGNLPEQHQSPGADSSRAWDERYAARELVWGAEPNRWVVRETTDLQPGRALDLAAGEGRNALWLASRGWQVTAVDFSGAALDRGRRLAAAQPTEAADRLTWVRADVRTYQPAAGAFDLVVVAYLHLPATQRRTALRHAAQALAPGGVLLVVGHDTTNLTDGAGGPQDPRILFTPDDVLADLAGIGLEPVRAERVRRPVAQGSDGRSAHAVDALVRLRRTTCIPAA
ncbi:class I SAM-dependent methyltransferase [Streptomyces sp. RY43-2]|uniref:Class I SAM-dependent methyltransferase n=1 Tax=Streptomyces macrolidinus TaxID=2952607 RepID=A0ABT0ZMJ7_9ACTN|nr:class I SAM-dependent methyltransferase [Streptomyces macrolidinus]MCN9244810.1 class I SAM-dependent methyltransferase [Streptomyces macrolidinus]